uniref:Guanylate cyclase activator 1g n=1 Tax=Scleropages formosus TaxID=113540 RepID=A0A8C9V9T8_SCLFO
MGQCQSATDEEVKLSQIQELYKKFAVECPSGKLHLHEFKKIFGINSDSSPEEAAYIENLFRSFDINEDDTLDFLEYVAAVHLVLRGSLEDKLRWSFKVYDSNGNGRLDKHEVMHIITIIHKIRNHSASPKTTALTPEQICDRIFGLIDKNKDGEISLEEFLEGAQQDKWLLDNLTLDVKPTGWFIEQPGPTHRATAPPYME